MPNETSTIYTSFAADTNSMQTEMLCLMKLQKHTAEGISEHPLHSTLGSNNIELDLVKYIGTRLEINPFSTKDLMPKKLIF